MKEKGDVQVRTASITMRDWLQDVELLVKFRLSTFVVFSSLVAYGIAAGGDMRLVPFLVLASGGFLITFAANILNEILEADYDRMMERTSNRPLAAKRWSASSALVLAGLCSLAGIVLLVVWAVRTGSRQGTGSTTQGADAIEIARRRYASGEISKEQFEQLRKDLGG